METQHTHDSLFTEGDLILDEKNDKHCTLDLFGADLTASIKCTEKAIFIRCKPSIAHVP